MDKVDEIDWDTEDDLEIEDFPISSGSIITNHDGETTVGSGIASSSTDPSYSKLINHFLAMGFPVKLVTEAIEENGEGNADAILETLLAYSALDNNSPQGKQRLHSDSSSSDYYESFLDDLSDSDSSLDIEDLMNPSSDQENKLLVLADMGYTIEEASIAIERCGTDSSIAELADFICAAQMARTADFHLGEEEKQKRKLLYNDYSKCKKRKIDHERLQQKKQKYSRKLFQESYDMSHIPNPMIGYGIPTDPSGGAHRTLPEAAVGPPYFYFENVALAPRGVWNTISRFLYEVEPEYVDSKYFCAAARKRGYIHNLPVENRFPLLPLPPCTINDALPLTRKWWPAWDMRTKLNCLQTCIGTARLTERIRKALENCEGDPPLGVQKYVLEECRKWNLVWVGRNKAAPLEPDEVEMLLGFPKNHTRGGGISRTDRYKSLGNSFQIDTVAYHLSVLKDLYPHGINLLSLFSGIGGAEVALHRLGIQLKNVVSVEISEVNRNIIKSWWEQTNQKGRLIEIADVQELDPDRLEELVNSLGGFDLVIGGSPCNNLTGSNRYTRDGLEGKDSSLFYHFFRILDSVRCMMGRKQ